MYVYIYIQKEKILPSICIQICAYIIQNIADRTFKLPDFAPPAKSARHAPRSRCASSGARLVLRTLTRFQSGASCQPGADGEFTGKNDADKMGICPATRDENQLLQLGSCPTLSYIMLEANSSGKPET